MICHNIFGQFSCAYDTRSQGLLRKTNLEHVSDESVSDDRHGTLDQGAAVQVTAWIKVRPQ